VGTLADVERVLALALPGFATDRHRALIEDGMLGGRRKDAGTADYFSNAPKRAAWLEPLSWWRTGWAVSGNVALIRGGTFSRDLVLVPLARMQGVLIRQGPFERRLRLASANLLTVAGPVSASLNVIDVDEARVLFEWMSVGAIRSALADSSHQWSRTARPAAVQEAAE
jgi:putative membrane protein